MAFHPQTGDRKGAREKATLARYNSECPLCRTRIYKDADEILPIEGDEWAHAQCVEDLDVEVAELDRPQIEKPGWWEA